MKRIILILISTVGLSLSSFGQDFKADLEKMQKAYANITSLHAQINIKAYKNAQSATPFFTENAELKKKGENYSYKLTGQEMLMNKDYLISVNHELEQVTCQKRNPSEEINVSQMVTPDLDSILNLYESPKYLGTTNGLKHYRVFQSSGLISQIDLYISTEDFLLRKLQYGYNEELYGSPSIVKIHFSEFNLHPTFSSETFHEKQYITMEGGRVDLISRLDAYELYLPETIKKQVLDH